MKLVSWAVLFLLMTVAAGCNSQKPGGTAVEAKNGTPSAPSAPVTHDVIMSGMQFQFRELQVRVGDTVVWKNSDIFPHTVTATDGSFDSGTIKPGESWSYVAKSAGVFPYHCTPHPNMTAKLIVK